MLFSVFITDADSTEFVMQEILKFIDSLYKQKFLDSIQRRALADLLLENRLYKRIHFSYYMNVIT